MKRTLYAEFRVKVYVPEDQLPDNITDPDPFDDAVEDLRASIESIEWEGLTYHEGVKIEVE